MYTSLLFLASCLAGSSLAKKCMNFTIPVDVDARNGVFNIPKIETNLQATEFIQNLTSIRGNFTKEALLGYASIKKRYHISAKFCTPDNDKSKDPTVQVLTHGIGFDKTYWDLPYNNYNYSYTDVAVNEFGFCTLAIDRLGVGNSSTGDPINEIQIFPEIDALYRISKMLRQGTLPNVPHAFTKIVHVGHSFGSIQSFALAALHPEVTDGLILTGYAANGSFVGETFASFDTKLARLNQPLRFGNVSIEAVTKSLPMISAPNVNVAQVEEFLARYNVTLMEIQSVVQSTDLANFITGIEPASLPKAANLPGGFLTWVDAGSNQYSFLFPGHFDPKVLPYTEKTKFPYTVGELLTLGSVPMMAKNFKGPVQILTGNEDLIFCGGDCHATGDPALASIPAAAKVLFPAARTFEAYVQPNTGHGITVHYNSTNAYRVSQRFLVRNGLAS